MCPVVRRRPDVRGLLMVLGERLEPAGRVGRGGGVPCDRKVAREPHRRGDRTITDRTTEDSTAGGRDAEATSGAGSSWTRLGLIVGVAAAGVGAVAGAMGGVTPAVAGGPQGAI